MDVVRGTCRKASAHTAPATPHRMGNLRLELEFGVASLGIRFLLLVGMVQWREVIIFKAVRSN